MDSENIKTSDPHKLVFNLADKINLKSSAKCIDLSICYAWKNIKTKTISYQPQHEFWNLV